MNFTEKLTSLGSRLDVCMTVDKTVVCLDSNKRNLLAFKREAELCGWKHLRSLKGSMKGGSAPTFMEFAF